MVERWRILRDYTTLCSSAPSEVLAIIALRAKETLLARNRQIVLDDLAAANHLLTTWPDVMRWLPPQAGPVAFPQWCGSGSLADYAARLRGRGVLMAPGDLFERPDHFRVGLGRADFPDTLAILEAINRG